MGGSAIPWWEREPEPGSVPAQNARAEAELARLGRQLPQVRLRLGELLEALAARHGHHELGFSSLEAYALERCGRTGRWCHDTRRLARRIQKRGLTLTRKALLSGRLTWSMADLLVRHARPEDEAALLEEAARKTVRQMKTWLAERKGEEDKPAKHEDEEEENVRTTRTVAAHEILMLESSRMLVEYINGARAGDEALMTALLGEAKGSLQSLVDLRIGIDLPPSDERALDDFRKRLAACEPPDVSPSDLPPVVVEVAEDPPLPKTLRGLDAEIRACGLKLTSAHIRMGRLAQHVLGARFWRRLGYPNATTYARERVGVSLSTLEHRITLYRRAATCPELGEALEAGHIGYEAALLIGRVTKRRASGEVVSAWIERARRRTVVHLREEVDAVLLRVGLDPSASRMPPDDELLDEVAELERQVQSGEMFRSVLAARPRPQMSVTLQTAPRGTDTRRTLRLTIPADLLDDWQRLETEFRRAANRKSSFLAFACFSLWSSWLPALEAHDEKWKAVYLRDRHRCTSPVCARHDVTPHHLRFQAYGGGHEPENVTSLCAWCHLHGIHEGRLTAAPPASNIHWTIGREPLMEVHGRERVLAG